MNLYHGSTKIVSAPKEELGAPYNDFGAGFYMTESAEKAGQWAVSRGNSGFVNKYVLETEGLNVLDLSSKKTSIITWLAFVLSNRSFRISDANVARFIQSLQKIYASEKEKYDIIIGPRADDSYYQVVMSFLKGDISDEQLKSIVYADSSDIQVVVISAKAYKSLNFIGCDGADSATYFPMRINCDLKLKKRARQVAAKQSSRGLYMHDILIGEA